MSRYIDADLLIALCDELSRSEWNKRASPASWSDAYEGFIDYIDDQPTADVVEVVRCKDCKYCERINSRDLYAKCRMTDLEFKPFDIDTRKHYCSYGERREE